MGVRGPQKRRVYSATEPVFAREDLRFSGRPVATRAQVPEDYFRSVRDRRVMWDARKIDHAQDLPLKKPSAPPSQAAPVPPPATVQSPEVAVTLPTPIDPNGAAVAAARYTARTYGAPVAFEKVEVAEGETRTLLVDGEPREFVAGTKVTFEPPPLVVNVTDQRPPIAPRRTKR